MHLPLVVVGLGDLNETISQDIRKGRQGRGCQEETSHALLDFVSLVPRRDEVDATCKWNK